MNLKDDGLLQRFHFCAPAIMLLDSEKILNGKTKKCSLEVVLFVVFKLCENGINFTLDSHAKEYFNEIYSQFRIYILKFTQKDGFLR